MTILIVVAGSFLFFIMFLLLVPILFSCEYSMMGSARKKLELIILHPFFFRMQYSFQRGKTLFYLANRTVSFKKKKNRDFDDMGAPGAPPGDDAPQSGPTKPTDTGSSAEFDASIPPQSPPGHQHTDYRDTAAEKIETAPPIDTEYLEINRDYSAGGDSGDKRHGADYRTEPDNGDERPVQSDGSSGFRTKITLLRAIFSFIIEKWDYLPLIKRWAVRVTERVFRLITFETLVLKVLFSTGNPYYTGALYGYWLLFAHIVSVQHSITVTPLFQERESVEAEGMVVLKTRLSRMVLLCAVILFTFPYLRTVLLYRSVKRRFGAPKTQSA